MLKGRVEEAEITLKKIRGADYNSKEFDELKTEHDSRSEHIVS